MTTDEALIEQIAQALFEDTYPTRLDGWPGVHGRFRAKWIEKAAAVLPVIRKAERDAAREALDGLEEFIRTDMDEPHGDRAASRVWGFRDTHYPEEKP